MPHIARAEFAEAVGCFTRHALDVTGGVNGLEFSVVGQARFNRNQIFCQAASSRSGVAARRSG
jgi:hypothetical protein